MSSPKRFLKFDNIGINKFSRDFQYELSTRNLEVSDVMSLEDLVVLTALYRYNTYFELRRCGDKRYDTIKLVKCQSLGKNGGIDSNCTYRELLESPKYERIVDILQRHHPERIYYPYLDDCIYDRKMFWGGISRPQHVINLDTDVSEWFEMYKADPDIYDVSLDEIYSKWVDHKYNDRNVIAMVESSPSFQKAKKIVEFTISTAVAISRTENIEFNSFKFAKSMIVDRLDIFLNHKDQDLKKSTMFWVNLFLLFKPSCDINAFTVPYIDTVRYFNQYGWDM